MHYDFPHYLTLNEVRDVVAAANARIGMNGFVLAERDGFVVANYIVAMQDSFPAPFTTEPSLNREYAILRELRGITFDAASGDVVARKFHKFFNVNEKPETQQHLIDWATPHVVLDKMDGSMITPYRHRDDGLEWHTKMGLTDVARPVNDFVRNSEIRYAAFAEACLTASTTPIFEWCSSRHQRIVVDYPEDRLVLLAIRHNVTGEYTPFEMMLDMARDWHIPVVDSHGQVADVGVFLNDVATMEGAEGRIVRFESGHALKTKSRWYLDIHRTKDKLTHEKDVWSLVLQDRVDDILPFLTEPDRTALEAFGRAMQHGVAHTALRLQGIVDAAKKAIGEDRRRFAQEWVMKPGVPALERGVLFTIWSGGDAVSAVRQVLLDHTSTSTQVEKVRAMADGARWGQHPPSD